MQDYSLCCHMSRVRPKSAFGPRARWLLLTLPAFPLACSKEPSKEPLGAPCGLYRDAGYRRSPICCGASSEEPGVTCVDLTADGGEYGIYGHCIAAGDTFEGKIAPALCCPGLVFRSPETLGPSAFAGYAPGCGPDLSFSPSQLICLSCGNSVCEPPENRCDCPEDCAFSPDAGLE
jgi:hypothetical protein